MPPLDPKRSFLAVELDQKTRALLETIQKELKESGADAKWVEPENIHLTLKFLGSVTTENIKDLIRALEENFAGRRAFDTTLGQLGCFPSINSPRVVWLGLEEKKGELKKCAAALEEGLSKLGFQKETREFQAHITLGRVRSPRNKIALIEKIQEANQDLKPETFKVDNITLFESKLSSHGPAYSIVYQVKLR